MAKWVINDFLSGCVCSGQKKKHFRNDIMYGLPWMMFFIFVTHEVICQWFKLMTASLMKIVRESPHTWTKNCYSLKAIRYWYIYIYMFIISNTTFYSCCPVCIPYITAEVGHHPECSRHSVDSRICFLWLLVISNRFSRIKWHHSIQNTCSVEVNLESLSIKRFSWNFVVVIWP